MFSLCDAIALQQGSCDRGSRVCYGLLRHRLTTAPRNDRLHTAKGLVLAAEPPKPTPPDSIMKLVIAIPMRNEIGRSNLSFYHNAKFVNSGRNG